LRLLLYSETIPRSIVFAVPQSPKYIHGVPRLKKIRWALNTSSWKSLQAYNYHLCGRHCRLIRKVKSSRSLLHSKRRGCLQLSSSMEAFTMHKISPDDQINRPSLIPIRMALKLKIVVLRLGQQFIDNQLTMEEPRLVLIEVLVGLNTTFRSLLFSYMT
jgi:hypothetical protein